MNCFFLPTSLVDIFFCVITFRVKTDGVAIISLYISHVLLLFLFLFLLFFCFCLFVCKYMIPQFCILQLVVLSTLGTAFLSASSCHYIRSCSMEESLQYWPIIRIKIFCTVNCVTFHIPLIKSDTAFLFLLLNKRRCSMGSLTAAFLFWFRAHIELERSRARHTTYYFYHSWPYFSEIY